MNSYLVRLTIKTHQNIHLIQILQMIKFLAIPLALIIFVPQEVLEVHERKRRLSGREWKLPQLVEQTKYLWPLLNRCEAASWAAYFQSNERELNSDLKFLIKNKIKVKYNYSTVWLFKNDSPKREKKLTLLSICLGLKLQGWVWAL